MREQGRHAKLREEQIVSFSFQFPGRRFWPTIVVVRVIPVQFAPRSSRCKSTAGTRHQAGGLADCFVAPETDRYANPPAPDATLLEPANRDTLSPDFTSADIAQCRNPSWQIPPQTGEPKLENLDGNLVGYVERHPSARNASHGTSGLPGSKSVNPHVDS